MPQTLKLNAIVLKKQTIKETDILLTLYSASHGKIRAVARGAKSITSRRLAALQTGNLCTLGVALTHGSYNIRDATLVTGFYSVKQNLVAFKYLTDVIFIIDRLMPEGVEDSAVFELYIRTLTQFAKCATPGELRGQYTSFCNEIMSGLGYIEDEPLELHQITAKIEEVIAEKLPR